MSDTREVSFTGIHLVGIEQLQKRWGWFVAMGIVMVVLGATAIGYSVLFTLASMVFIGWLMVIGGLLQTAHAFGCKEWGGFFVDLLAGILYAVAGFLIIAHPAATALALTLLIAVLLIFSGIFRIVLAIAVRFHNSGWLILHGIINLLLGISICQDWPLSGLWVIGLFIGVDMLFNGWSLIMLGLAAKGLPKQDH